MVYSQSASGAPGGVEAGLRVWLRADSGITAADGEGVLLWADFSGQENHAAYNPSNNFGELPPLFDASNPGINGRPSVRFNGQNALQLDLSFLAGSEYTIFVVNARDRGGNANFFLAGESIQQDANLILGYETVDRLRQSHWDRDMDALVEPYTGTPIWSQDVFRLATDSGKEIYRDGSPSAWLYQPQPLISNNGTTLGHFRPFGDLFWFVGDLAEIIVYDRALSSDEQSLVESELAARYGRPLDSRITPSTWASTPPAIDGEPTEQPWQQTVPIPLNLAHFPIGTLRFLNDSDYLYVLLDVTLDDVDDPPPTFEAPGDFFWLYFDVNENGVLDPNVDLLYSGSNDGICRAELLGPNTTTGCLGTVSVIGKAFGESPWSPTVHRVIELALDLSEISAAPGEQLRLGLDISSAIPQFRFKYPVEAPADMTRLYRVNLAEMPEVPIFLDSFESQE